MATSFNLKQLLDFAISRERESAALYNALAQKTNKTSLKKLFQELAKQEVRHEAFYARLAKQFVAADATPESQENEYTVYMRNIIEEHAASFEVTSEHIFSVSQGLDYAIAREKNSILFYSGLKNYIPKEAEPILDTIIQEEMKHAAILMDIKINKKYK